MNSGEPLERFRLCPHLFNLKARSILKLSNVCLLGTISRLNIDSSS